MVKEVEELGAEFDARPFGNGRLLENRKVEVVDALLPQSWIHSRLVAEPPVWRSGETGYIEPSAQLGRRASGHRLVATRYNVRPEPSNSEARTRK